MPLLAILVSMRPRQWTKNLVVFAALIFSLRMREVDLLLQTILGFAVFCVMSGVVYILNDLKDREADALHPRKRTRPIASGALSPAMATATFVVLTLGGAGVAYFAIGLLFFQVVVAYLVLNVLYSFVLRDMVLLDVMAIATGFVLRAIGGAEILIAAGEKVPISPWLLMCTFFLSLFLALGKRRNELTSVDAEHRTSLKQYSVALVDRLTGITVAVTILSYSIYTIWPATVEKFGTAHLIYTIPFVFYGLGRYLYLVVEEDKGGDPSEMLLTDRSIILTVVLWFLTVGWILYIAR
jgi:4-hydroxybenzoate polyprenyltransferase